MINKNVLVIEDDEAFRQTIIKQFNQVGVSKCIGAGDGFSGVQEILKLQKQNRHFDLILASLRLPKINGYKLIIELRKRFPEEKLPFVMMLSEADGDKLNKILGAGIDDHLFKPFSLDTLKECLKKVWHVLDKDFEVKKLASPSVGGNPLVSMGKVNASLDTAFADAGKKTATKKKSAGSAPKTFNFDGPTSEPKKSAIAPPPVIAPPPAVEKEKPKSQVKSIDTSSLGSGATGSSYQSTAATLVPKDMEVGPVDASLPIDGVYFKLIQLVHGVDKNYFWAKDVEGKETVELFLLTRTCKKSPIVLETVSRGDFCSTYFSSEKYGCDLDGYES